MEQESKATRDYLGARRWPNGVNCPRRESPNVLFLEEYSRRHCPQGHDAPQFKQKTGTRRQKELQPVIWEHIEAGAAIFSDRLKPYEGLGAAHQPAVINHSGKYLDGNVHTNGIERDYRFKNRKVNDSERFDPVMPGMVEKRLAFDHLTGRQEAYG